MTKVSVIVTSYNIDPYIEACLTSIERQEAEDLEILIVDDASTDRTVEKIKQFIVTHSKYPIKLLENEKNQGPSITRNRAMSLAKGDYIGFIDGDDFIHPKMYRRLCDLAEQEQYPDLVATNFRKVFHQEQIPSDHTDLSKYKVIIPEEDPLFMTEQQPCCWNKIYRRDFITDQRFLEGKIWEDFAFTYSQLIRAEKMIQDTNYHYYYRRHSGGIMNSFRLVGNAHLLDIFDNMDALEQTAKNTGRWDTFQGAVRELQIGSCIERVNSLKYWAVPEEQVSLKNLIKKDMLELLGYYPVALRKTGSSFRLESTFYQSEYGPFLNRPPQRPKEVLKTEIQETLKVLRK